MKTLLNVFASLLFSTFLAQAQQSNIFVLTLNSDNEDFTLVQQREIEVNNTQSVVMSGLYQSEISVLIKSLPASSITIIPASDDYNEYARGGGGGTTIRSQSGGAGHTPPPPPPPQTFTVYPNPVSTNLTFKSQGVMLVAYEIYDYNGQIKDGQTITPTNEFTVNVSQYNNGNYVLRLQTENNQYVSIQFIKI
jgi:Secretion system C-terminal sorting domain